MPEVTCEGRKDGDRAEGWAASYYHAVLDVTGAEFAVAEPAARALADLLAGLGLLDIRVFELSHGEDAARTGARISGTVTPCCLGRLDSAAARLEPADIPWPARDNRAPRAGRALCTKTCAVCSAEFAGTSSARFCSDDCRDVGRREAAARKAAAKRAKRAKAAVTYAGQAS